MALTKEFMGSSLVERPIFPSSSPCFQHKNGGFLISPVFVPYGNKRVVRLKKSAKP